jgi:hypothetical protein
MFQSLECHLLAAMKQNLSLPFDEWEKRSGDIARVGIVPGAVFLFNVAFHFPILRERFLPI